MKSFPQVFSFKNMPACQNLSIHPTLQPTPGTMQGNTLNWIFANTVIMGNIRGANLPNCMFLDCGRKPESPEEIYKTGKNMQTL